MPKQATQQIVDEEDPFEGLGESTSIVAAPGNMITQQTQADLPATVREKFRAMEDHLSERYLAILEDASYARDIDATSGELFDEEEWNHLTPLERAKRRQIALSAHQNKKNAPVHLDLAVRVVTGLAKARASEKEVVERKLNVQVAVISVPMPQFEEIIVEREER